MIENWMKNFKDSWLAKDVDGVFDLLSDDVEYWETPFEKLCKGKELREEWNGVKTLDNMELEYSILASDTDTNRHAIVFNFKYGSVESAGVYLVGLNEQGICNYFYRASITR
jgi:hypothetical protein